MHFVRVTQNGAGIDIDLEDISSVKQVNPPTVTSVWGRFPKGAVIIYRKSDLGVTPYVLNLAVDIQAFYAAFYAFAYNGVTPPPVPTLGS